MSSVPSRLQREGFSISICDALNYIYNDFRNLMMRLYFLASIFWLLDSSALQMLILIASALQMRMDRECE